MDFELANVFANIFGRLDVTDMSLDGLEIT